MDSITVILIIVVLLVGLVGYAFISQALEQKRQKRHRLLTALQIRANNFKYMLHSFPPGFLSPELALFVQRNLVDICEQLVHLDPKNPAHKQDMQALVQQMNGAQQPDKASSLLENPQQIKDIKSCLEELYKVIFHQEARRALNNQEAETYRLQIRQLMLGVTVDSYIIHGHSARQRDKIQLAQHYFTLAQKLLLREDVTGAFELKKTRLQAWLEELGSTQQLAPVTEVNKEDSSEQAEIDKAWEKFAQAEESWKKKNVYD